MAGLLLLCFGAVACAPVPAPPPGRVPLVPRREPRPTPAQIVAAADTAPVRVFYPRGGCRTRMIEIEVYERSETGGTWRPHPSHPRVRAGTCHTEDPGGLLNEIRVRCVDPAGRLEPSGWVVGADIRRPVDAERCQPPASVALPQRAPRRASTLGNR